MCVWRRLGVCHKRLGVVNGVGRRASPRRLKNIGKSYVNASMVTVRLPQLTWCWPLYTNFIREIESFSRNKLNPIGMCSPFAVLYRLVEIKDHQVINHYKVILQECCIDKSL